VIELIQKLKNNTFPDSLPFAILNAARNLFDILKHNCKLSTECLFITVLPIKKTGVAVLDSRII